MDKLRFSLLLLSIAIIVFPLAATVALYSGNFVELVLPVELQNLLSGNYSEFFTPPTLQSVSEFDLAQQTVTFTFSFTNPLPNPITMKNITSFVECAEHTFTLGNLVLPQSVIIEAHQTANIEATYHFTPEGILHILAAHLGQNDLGIVFADLDVELAGATIHVDKAVAGSIPLTLG
jgi:hypothetical protein